MLHILGFLFIIIIAILVIGLTIIGTVFRRIFGLGKRRSTSSGTYQSSSQNNQSANSYSSQKEETTETEGTSSLKRKKLFAKEDGEYVDFEEVKEE